MKTPAPVLACLLLPLVAAAGATPAGAECRLALALGMDVSRSVDARDFAIQVEGLATALEDPAVREAFFAPSGDVAVTVYHWSGEAYQEVVAAWTVIHAPADLDALAAQVRSARRPELRLLTALGEAVAFGRSLLEGAPRCGRQVIDIAGDGQNNQGRSPGRVYQAEGWEEITVNALAIRSHEIGLVDYFRDHLIHGVGAFVEVAESERDFPPAIRRKLIRELTEAVALAPGPGRETVGWALLPMLRAGGPGRKS